MEKLLKSPVWCGGASRSSSFTSALPKSGSLHAHHLSPQLRGQWTKVDGKLTCTWLSQPD
ncbi:MAG TPA: hypothetical protein V6D18_06490 [Thermosynechococcaceae cyanobacterium]